MRYQRRLSNEEAVRMIWGKLVADLILPLNSIPNPASATPCNASDHHWYAGIPRRGIPGAVLTSCEIFSSIVNRETRSWTRWLIGRDIRQNGNDLDCGFEESQENGGSEEVASGRYIASNRRFTRAILPLRLILLERFCERREAGEV